MDIRKVAKVADVVSPYYKVNREERFYCATLYALLVQSNHNLRRFVSYLNSRIPIPDRVDENRSDQFEVYVEYAYLRDIWESIGRDNHDNQKKRKIIEALGLRDASRFSAMRVVEFNNDFVGLGRPSEEYIQNPGTWSISKYSRHFPDNDEGNKDFLKVTKFKWSFNIKPDIVIQVSPDRVLSIEAKLESGEGRYPSSESDKKVFGRRGLKSVGQIELQRFMFEELLGMKASLFFLLKDKKKGGPNNVPQLTWNDVFARLDFSETHRFVREALASKGLRPSDSAAPIGVR